jgi:hypothetical protein
VKIRSNKIIMWTVLTAIGILIVLSIISAFYGSQRAKLIFNSIPSAFYFCTLAILLATGFIRFRSLVRKPAMFMTHAGFLMVLAGGIWGSQGCHYLRSKLFGSNKIPGGYMVIFEGQSQNKVYTEDFELNLGQLPFSIKLKDFRIEYYESTEPAIPLLLIQTPGGKQLELPAEIGKEISVENPIKKIKITNIFNNFKIRFENGQKIISNEKEGHNPAVEIKIERSDGTAYTHYVFERFPGFNHNKDGLVLKYVLHKPMIIRDYLSQAAVIKDGNEVTDKVIELNHPLHYGGYHFYQHSYDSEEGKYTILSMTSDSGLYMVYSGYWLICAGLVWHFWFKRPASSANPAIPRDFTHQEQS